METNNLCTEDATEQQIPAFLRRTHPATKTAAFGTPSCVLRQKRGAGRILVRVFCAAASPRHPGGSAMSSSDVSMSEESTSSCSRTRLTVCIACPRCWKARGRGGSSCGPSIAQRQGAHRPGGAKMPSHASSKAWEEAREAVRWRGVGLLLYDLVAVLGFKLAVALAWSRLRWPLLPPVSIAAAALDRASANNSASRAIVPPFLTRWHPTRSPEPRWQPRWSWHSRQPTSSATPGASSSARGQPPSSQSSRMQGRWCNGWRPGGAWRGRTREPPWRRPWPGPQSQAQGP